MDETLIWKEKLHTEAIKWLKSLQKGGFWLKLRTRHELCIETVLAKAGLSEEMFDDILRVYPNPKNPVHFWKCNLYKQ